MDFTLLPSCSQVSPDRKWAIWLRLKAAVWHLLEPLGIRHQLCEGRGPRGRLSPHRASGSCGNVPIRQDLSSEAGVGLRDAVGSSGPAVGEGSSPVPLVMEPDNSRPDTQGALGKGWKASPAACLSQHLHSRWPPGMLRGCRPALSGPPCPLPSFWNLSEFGMAADRQAT